MKKLCEIIKCDSDILITGVKTDSRDVMPGDLFVAIKGFNVNHSDYIEDAISRGAVAIVSDVDINMDIVNIKVKDVNKALIDILKNFYDNIQDSFKFIGITGTDGKTTTATISSYLLNACYIGTNGISYKNFKESTNNTTPDACTLFNYFVKLKRLGCKVIVMEISSEALLHGRVDGIKFDIVALTNISEDHLNVHGSIDNYINSKCRLFKLVKNNSVSILNSDDDYYDVVKNHVNNKLITYGKNSALFNINNVVLNRDNSSFDIIYDNKKYSINSKLPYLYNVYNMTLAFVISYFSGMDCSEIIKKISEFSHVDGRCEVVGNVCGADIILDYAHTFNGIKSLVENSKKFYKNILVVTGSAGGREVEKRSKIGKYLLDNVKFCIFTMDDPRYENVSDIISQMVSKSDKKNFLEIVDRKEAIKKALDMAEEFDAILIIGKGRDNYMAIENKKIKYSDYEVINKYLNEKKS